ncbi:hypothetical protein HMPREF3038_01326 [Akkermansia sp. KLE1797]|nr:hypothetical protein HMPREF3038_01326 [Akkermansia sp. KLE1797]KXU55502.1 hypothetical protein HMPREF3039_00233 [Akkermansia sp. KLE1798]KZA03558.1 hypothetical protein HMPREF1326_02790 [Akkermansia sp. KLE1605]
MPADRAPGFHQAPAWVPDADTSGVSILIPSGSVPCRTLWRVPLQARFVYARLVRRASVLVTVGAAGGISGTGGEQEKRAAERSTPAVRTFMG